MGSFPAPPFQFAKSFKFVCLFVILLVFIFCLFFLGTFKDSFFRKPQSIVPGKTPVGVMDRKTEWRPRDAKASQKCRRPTVRPSVRPSVHHRIFDQKWKLEKLYESKGIESKLRPYRPVGGKSHLAHLFVFFGRPWQAMTGHGRPWQAMAGHGRPWPAMVGHDRP